MVTRELIQQVAAQTAVSPDLVRRVMAAVLAMMQADLAPGPASGEAPGAPAPRPAPALDWPQQVLRWPAHRIARLEQQFRAAAPLTGRPEDASEATLDDLEIRNLLRVLTDWRALEQRALPGSLLQERLGVSRQRLQQLRAASKLLGVRIPLHREWYYPVWQFGPDGAPLPDLARVLAAARAVPLDRLALDALMVSPRAGDGVAPAERLRHGQLDLVLGIIRAAGDQGV